MLQVPIFVISSVAEELLAFSNVIPEWLCKQRQEKVHIFGENVALWRELLKDILLSFWLVLQLYSGKPLFGHVDLIKGKKLHLFPALHSETLL